MKRRMILLLALMALACTAIVAPCCTNTSRKAVVTGTTREEYYRKLIDEYTAPRKTRPPVDAPDPLEPLILKEGDAMADFIAKRYEQNQPPLSIIWILGRLGSPAAYSMLIAEYQARPNMRTATCMGACLNAASVDDLRTRFPGRENDLRLLLETIYGREWADVKALDTQAILDHLKANLPRIKDSCKRRNQPMYG